jgi:hypothetical protein
MPITNQQGVQNVNLNIFANITGFWQSYYQDLADYKQLLKLIEATNSGTAYNKLRIWLPF